MLDVGGGHTRSELEDALHVLIGRHRIRPPLFNEPLGSYVADALWPEQHLVVELDSRMAHNSEPAFFTDREKDLVYAEHGLECLRLTWRQVVGQETRIAGLLLSRVGRA
jgi:very-short-patch-repair endonuclease